MFSGLVGCLFGFVMMIRAPGNSLRLTHFSMAESLLDRYGSRIITASQHLKNYFGMAIVLFVILLCAQAILAPSARRTLVAVGFAVVALATVYALVLAPIIAYRALFGAMVFLVIACARSFAGLQGAERAPRLLCTCALSLLLVQAGMAAVPAGVDILTTSVRMREREAFVMEQVAAGKRKLIVPLIEPMPRTTYNPHQGLEDLQYEHAANSAFARYYGVDRVIAVPYAEWRALYPDA